MIGFVHDLIVEHVLAPQADPARGEARVYLDAESRPIDVEAQEIDVRDGTTIPISYEIGGGIELRHTISVAVDIQHGDPVKARRLRDRVLLDLTLRTVDAREAIQSAVDDASGQYVTTIGWTVDYAPLGASDTNESATILFTVDTMLDR